ncbi:MAG: Plug domain-containing protein, partial [Myxococcota bacterium]
MGTPRLYRSLVFVVLFLAQSAASVGVRAQPDDEEFSLGTVVRAKRDPESTPDTVDVVETAPWADSGRTVSDLVSSVPGVTLRRTGAAQSFTILSIRGLSGRNVAVVLDELPLNNATLSPFDLALFDLDELEQIEVYRSSAPARFNTPLGGLIRLRTAVPETTSSRVHLGFGTLGDRRFNAAHTEKGQAGSLSVRLAGATGDYDYRYFDDAGTTFNEQDDTERLRDNNAQTRAAGSIRFEQTRSTGRVSALAWVRGRDQEVPGPGTQTLSEATSSDVEVLLRLDRS